MTVALATHTIDEGVQAALAPYIQRHVVAYLSRAFTADPAGWFHPPRSADAGREAPAGRDWVHEVKHDGYRLLASKVGDRVVLWTRYGTDFTDRLPAIAEAVRSSPVDNALLDGEAVALRADGHGDGRSVASCSQSTAVFAGPRCRVKWSCGKSLRIEAIWPPAKSLLEMRCHPQTRLRC